MQDQLKPRRPKPVEAKKRTKAENPTNNKPKRKHKNNRGQKHTGAILSSILPSFPFPFLSLPFPSLPFPSLPSFIPSFLCHCFPPLFFVDASYYFDAYHFFLDVYYFAMQIPLHAEMATELLWKLLGCCTLLSKSLGSSAFLDGNYFLKDKPEPRF